MQLDFNGANQPTKQLVAGIVCEATSEAAARDLYNKAPTSSTLSSGPTPRLSLSLLPGFWTGLRPLV